MTSKSDLVMTLLRKFVLKCLQLNISFKAQHVFGCQNSLTDSLSRLQFQRFYKLAQDADSIPSDAMFHFRDEIARLLDASISANTRAVYSQALKNFKDFRLMIKLPDKWNGTSQRPAIYRISFLQRLSSFNSFIVYSRY